MKSSHNQIGAVRDDDLDIGLSSTLEWANVPHFSAWQRNHSWKVVNGLGRALLDLRT